MWGDLPAGGRGEGSAIMSESFKDLQGNSSVPDVDAIMQRVRAGVADKLERGVYTAADLEEMRSLERDLERRADTGATAVDDIARLHASWDPFGPYAFTSHRAFVGNVFVAAKRVLRRLARPVVAITLSRQAEFNGAVARLLTDATNGVRSLEAGDAALLRRLDDLEGRNRGLSERCDRLETEVRGLRARLEADGKPTG